MVTYNEYLKSVLEKIVDSHHILTELDDKPGDLVVIQKELLKIKGFSNVIITKLKSENYSFLNNSKIKSKLEFFLENYYFEKEIETMSSLYANDSSRLKNMRLKILEALDDRKLMDEITQTIENL